MLILDESIRNPSVSSHEIVVESATPSEIESELIELSQSSNNTSRSGYRSLNTRSSIKLITDFEEFSQKILSIRKRVTAVLFVKHKHGLPMECKAFEEAISSVSDKIEGYCFITKDPASLLGSRFECVTFPMVTVFRGASVILAVDGEAKYERLRTELSKMLLTTLDSEATGGRGGKKLRKADSFSIIKAAGKKLLDDLLSRSYISGMPRLRFPITSQFGDIRKRILLLEMQLA